MNDERPTINERGSLKYLVPLASLVGILWGCLYLQPYWAALSAMTLGWSLWASLSYLAITDLVWTLTAGSILAGPLLAQLTGALSADLWETLFAPVVLYLMSLGTIWSTLGAARAYGPQTLVFLTSTAAVALGCAILLFMFYMGTALAAPPFRDNSMFMGYMIGIFGGTAILAFIDRLVWLRKESPLSAGAPS